MLSYSSVFKYGIIKNMQYTWVEIDTKALISNITQLKKVLSRKKEVMVVLKANAYGHGFNEISDVLKSNNKVDWFAVFEFSDALLLRKKTNKPILVLSTTEHTFWPEAIKKNISVTLSRYDQLLKLQKFTKRKLLKIHLKIDTGLGRQGFVESEISHVVALISNSDIKLEGLYTHFSGTESKIFDAYTKKQYESFIEWKKAFVQIGLYPKTHLGATSGSLRDDRLSGDIARFGIGVYGLWPSDETRVFKKNVILKPVLSWKTKIVEIKKLKKGDSVTYDRGCILQKDSVVATIPVGYFDGLPRALSNRGFALVQGIRVPIIGKIMMNMIALDVTQIKKTSIGDIVTLIGKDKSAYVSADEVALWAGSINYEIVTRINPLIRRSLLSLQKSKK